MIKACQKTVHISGLLGSSSGARNFPRSYFKLRRKHYISYRLSLPPAPQNFISFVAHEFCFTLFCLAVLFSWCSRWYVYLSQKFAFRASTQCVRTTTLEFQPSSHALFTWKSPDCRSNLRTLSPALSLFGLDCLLLFSDSNVSDSPVVVCILCSDWCSYMLCCSAFLCVIC